MSQSERLVDTCGRLQKNLRISVTDRCNIRCSYCMPENVTFLPKSEVLRFEEIERVVRVAAGLGVDKLRLTGGEPLVRRDLPVLIRSLVEVPGIVDVGLTTNGILLAPMAQRLRDAGLRRINVSLDTMNPETFERITRRPGFEKVIEGTLAAKAAGFDPVKVNAVAIRGQSASSCGSSNTCRSTPATPGSATRSCSPPKSWSDSATRSARSRRIRSATAERRRSTTTTTTAAAASA